MNPSHQKPSLSFWRLERIFHPLDCSTLVCFRVAFGALLFGATCLSWPSIEASFPVWEFRPTYTLLELTHAWPRPDMHWVFAVMLFGSFGLMLGLFTRFSAFAIGF